MKDLLPQSGKEGSVTYKLHFFITSVAEHLQVILNHERNGIIFQTFLEHRSARPHDRSRPETDGSAQT